MTTPTKVRVSEADYLASMTGVKPSLEFVNGEVIQKPMTKRDHNDVGKVLLKAFFPYEEQTGGYFTWEATTDLSEEDDRRYRVPDHGYWGPGRPISRPDDIYLPPTLAIEVRSEGQAMAPLREKCREYRSRGVDVCWLIDPQRRTAEVFEDGRDAERLPADGALESTRLPGFRVPLAELWAALQ